MKELKPKSQCVLYARKSTEEDDQQIMSIEAQLFELREFAERERIEIVKEFRGTLRAFFWQSLGVIFGINLKTEYDPQGDDKNIEQIVQMIENGTL